MNGTPGCVPAEQPASAAELAVQLKACEQQFRQLAGLLPDAGVAWFDTDVRLVVVDGQVRPEGQDPAAMQGKLLIDAVSARLLVLLEAPYRAALEGRSSEVEYVNPGSGRSYHTRVQPVRDVVGGLSLTVDVTEETARRVQLGQVRELTQLGFGVYDTGTGWSFDAELMRLWGFEGNYDSDTFRNHLIIPEDRERSNAAWSEIYAHGGQVTTQYRMHHGVTGQLRHMECVFAGELGADGSLLHGVVTHIDVTGSVTLREAAQAAELRRAADRTALLRQVSEALGTSRGEIDEVGQSVTDLAAAVLGDGAVLRILTADHVHVQPDLSSHRNPRERVRLRQHLVRTSAATLNAIVPPVVSVDGLTWSNDDGPETDRVRRALRQRFGLPVAHFIVAPARQAGVVYALLTVFRVDHEAPYEPGDDDVLQVLADRLATAIAASRSDRAVEQERQKRQVVAERLQMLSHDQMDLLEQLAATEARERSLLAEAVHDDPLQLIVAAIMRLDMVRLRFPDQESQEMDRIATLLETSVDQLRRLIVAMAPMDLSGGLGPALYGLAQGIFIGTTTEVHMHGPTHVHLAPPAKANAYRIVREALVNVRRHAAAANVTISLSNAVTEVLISVSDDGVGARTLDAGPGHLGMGSMRSRAHGEGGRMEITSTPGHGTVVVVALPVTAPATLPSANSAGHRRTPNRVKADRNADTHVVLGREPS